MKIHHVLYDWNEKFRDHNINYNEVETYSSNQAKLLALSNMLCASSLVRKCEEIESVKKTFLTNYETLNVLMIKYIPHHPNAKWCSLMALLEEYGVCLPQEAQDIIQNKVSFPDTRNQSSEAQLYLRLSTASMFQPGHNISVGLHPNMTLKELSELVQSITSFLQPLIEHLPILVFFKLKGSVLFNKYLHHYLKKIAEAQQTSKDTLQVADYSHPDPDSFTALSSKQDPAQGLDITILTEALKDTFGLVDKVMSGEATYSELIAGDKLMLEQLEIEREFIILSGYEEMFKTPSWTDHFDGLKRVQSMLELFQYTTHIKNIKLVCEQYHLECLNDPQLKELMDIMEAHTSEGDRSKITPLDASKKMKRVKELLCMGVETDSKCLDIFEAMTNSIDFYQFVRDKEFYTKQGQAIFQEQCQLITLQLQHEEYDDEVLNHLFPAFTVISPFMDVTKSFPDLMKEVTALNAVNGLKQLKTVNDNITLIRLWFSRAEVIKYI